MDGTDPAPGTGGSSGNPPVLWHLKVSHYSEKARWALDYKRVPHVRRDMTPGQHRPVARKLTGGRTFPILVLDGEAIADSTRIIEALERRHPDPALYPSDTEERRRAVELEDFFDEELGPHLRLLVIGHLIEEPGLFLRAFAPDLGMGRRMLARASFGRLRRAVLARIGIDERSMELAYRKLAAAGDRFRQELQPSGYLSGRTFGVVDLTLAALLAPAIAPEEFPYPQPQRGHRLLAPVREALAESGLGDWALDLYARHRGRSAEIAG